MRRFLFVAICLTVLSILILSVPNNSRAETDPVKGDYVEVRTASVFAGACHYNGELTTSGREALMAWNVKSGQWHGVDLAGVRVLAIVSSAENLSQENSARQAEILIGD